MNFPDFPHPELRSSIQSALQTARDRRQLKAALPSVIEVSFSPSGRILVQLGAWGVFGPYTLKELPRRVVDDAKRYHGARICRAAAKPVPAGSVPRPLSFAELLRSSNS